MLSLHCPAEGRTVLLSPRRITGLEVRPDEVVIDAVCWCGTEIHHVERRGRPADPVAAEPVGAAA